MLYAHLPPSGLNPLCRPATLPFAAHSPSKGCSPPTTSGAHPRTPWVPTLSLKRNLGRGGKLRNAVTQRRRRPQPTICKLWVNPPPHLSPLLNQRHCPATSPLKTPRSNCRRISKDSLPSVCAIVAQRISAHCRRIFQNPLIAIRRPG